MNDTPKNIIVKMPNWIGDAVMATPVLEDLKKKFPDAKISLFCLSHIAALFAGNPFVDEVISYKKPSGWIHRKEHRDLVETLRMGGYDLGILLTNSFSSAWWFYCAGIKERIGFKTQWRSLLLTKGVPYPKDLEKEHLVNTYKRLLVPLGITHSSTTPRLYLTEEDRKVIDSFLSLYKVPKGAKILGINPGAAYGSAKCWPPERFREVTQKLNQDQSLYILYFGDNQSKPMIEGILEGINGNVIDLSGKTTLRELVALISCCTVLLTNDSGPMHIASALKVPLLALFGSTNEVKTGPYYGEEVIHKHVKCSPCYKRVCPIDFRCMRRIEAEEVYNKVEKLLNSYYNTTKK